MNLQPIAHFRSPFSTKFGIPKQSGLVEELTGEIVFEPAFRNEDALRGLENFDYLWLIWAFSANPHASNSLTVRPPLLGGNERVGVFASRSPFRPNPIGLSCVKIVKIEHTNDGPIIHVSGADLMDGTPIFDVKPYVPYADAHPDARAGFVDSHPIERLRVEIPDEVARLFSEKDLIALRKTLELDPRPHYQKNPTKVYGMPFAQFDIHFRVNDDDVLIVLDAIPLK